jgi:hypothetical protein
MHTGHTSLRTHVTLGQKCDSRASRVPTPTPTPTKSLERRFAPALGSTEGAALRGGSGRGPDDWTDPAAARLHEVPRGSRRAQGVFSDQEFRALCKLVRAEMAAHPALDGSDLMEWLKCAAARARLAYDGPVLGRVLDVVQPRQRLAQRHAEPAPMHWRERCERRGHERWCQTPTQCDLRAAKEGE